MDRDCDAPAYRLHNKRGMLRSNPRPPTHAVILGGMTLLRPVALGGIPAIVATSDPASPALRSRHAGRGLIVPPLSPHTERQALAALSRVGMEEADRSGRRPLLVYGDDQALGFVHRHQDELGRAFALLLNEADVASAAMDKQRFFGFARERGVRVPDTLAEDEPLYAAERLGEPIVVKPRNKEKLTAAERAWLGDAKARFYAFRQLLADPAVNALRDRLCIQARAAGGVTDLCSFHGFRDAGGELLAWFTGRKLRTHPSDAGESSLIELTDDRSVAEAGREVSRRLGLRGVFKIDMVRDPESGELVTLEVNPRFNLWHYLGAVHGVNLPLVAHQHLVEGRAVDPPSYTPRLCWIDMHRDWGGVRTAGLPALGWLWSVAKTPKVYELFAWDDPWPAMVWLGEAVRQQLATARRRMFQQEEPWHASE